MTRVRAAGRFVAPLIAASALVVTVATIVFSWGRESADGFGVFGVPSAIGIAAYCAYALVGGLVAARRPTNLVGWIFLVGGTAMTVQLGLEEYAHQAVVLEPGRWAGAVAVDWVAEWLWVLPMSALQFSTLLFPTGALPSRRWRPVAAVLVVGDLLLLVLVPIATWPLRGRLASDALLTESPLWPLLAPLAMAMAVASVLCALSLLVRYRHARGDERFQLRWLAWAAVVFVLGVTVQGAFGVSPVGEAVTSTTVWPAIAGALGTIALPVAAALAILKRRLYDIDRIVSRTVGYGLVSLALIATYAGGVMSAQRLLGGREAPEVVVAGATLAAAALFRPLRQRVQSRVDRRFDRRAYDGERLNARFATRLRDQVDLDTVVAELATTTSEALRPSRVSLWLGPSQEGGR